MSAVAAPPATVPGSGRAYGVAAIGRAGRLVATLGGRFSTERGILDEGGYVRYDEHTHLRLPVAPEALRGLRAASHLDVRDLESGLMRLSLSHDLAGCPGGKECLACGSDRDRLLHL